MEFVISQYVYGFSLGLGVWLITLGASSAWRTFRYIIGG